MVESNALVLAAGSLVSDPNDDSKRVEDLLNHLDEAQGDAKVAKPARDTLQQLHGLRAKTMAELTNKALKAGTSRRMAERNASSLLIGMLRTILTRRLVQGETLTPEEDEVYERIRVLR